MADAEKQQHPLKPLDVRTQSPDPVLQQLALLQRRIQVEEALERVRTRTMAMHHSDELAETASVMFQQLLDLGIKTVACGLIIIDPDNATGEVWLSADGQVIPRSFLLRLNEDPAFTRILSAWKSKERFRVEDLTGETLVQHYRYLIEQGMPVYEFLEAAEASHSERLVIHAIFFSHGFIGVNYTERLDNQLDILTLFARVFDQTYTRFLDLKKAETALLELKAAQAQLIHSEKMASLGQLTAGIAHEIKNPLNFINNFAAVNEELAEELLGALLKGENLETIVVDLKQNAQIIARHGKRADDIVHAMMQHASGGTGRREKTDIYTLISEHIDLAYHGKRAQVAEFNVEIERNLAVDVGYAEVVPQEIGRVFLNLLSNAFDAVQKQQEPKVTVSVRKVDDQVQVRITDNGPGIPEEIKEKIFQPFFTTKPPGTGTGLGLSLSYDIILGHGGTLTAESVEGQGATFIVTLPANKTKSGSSD